MLPTYSKLTICNVINQMYLEPLLSHYSLLVDSMPILVLLKVYLMCQQMLQISFSLYIFAFRSIHQGNMHLSKYLLAPFSYCHNYLILYLILSNAKTPFSTFYIFKLLSYYLLSVIYLYIIRLYFIILYYLLYFCENSLFHYSYFMLLSTDKLIL